MSRQLSIDIYLDFICPWCLIGKRQLQRAQRMLLDEQPDVQLRTVWHGVQLLPQLPTQGENFAQFYRYRLGSADAVRARQAQVQQACAEVGVAIDFSRISTLPNTADAHRLLERARALGDAERVDALIERLFAAYFQQGMDLGCRSTLLAIAQASGFQAQALTDWLHGDGRPFTGRTKATRGVPSFHFNGHLQLIGAQPAQLLLDAMRHTLLASTSARQAV